MKKFMVLFILGVFILIGGLLSTDNVKAKEIYDVYEFSNYYYDWNTYEVYANVVNDRDGWNIAIHLNYYQMLNLQDMGVTYLNAKYYVIIADDNNTPWNVHDDYLTGYYNVGINNWGIDYYDFVSH